MRVSLKEYISFAAIDLSDLIERSNGYSRSELTRLIELWQERLILRLCGQVFSKISLQEGRLILEDSSHRHWKDKVQGKEGYMERGREGFLSYLEALYVPALYEANEKEYKLVK